MTLDIFLPGLTRQVLYWEKYYSEQFRYPALEWVLARSRLVKSQNQTVESYLFNLFSVDQVNHAPVAALRHSNSPALCADPIHLQVDTSDLYLNAGESFSLDHGERQEIEALLNSHLTEHGWEFVFTPAGTGVIKLDEVLQISTTPLSEVSGKGITQFLPVGDDARAVHQLMNEIQMLLHHAEFNKARQAEGKLPVNAVWIWGGGSLPELNNQAYSIVTCSNATGTYGVSIRETLQSLCNLTGIVYRDDIDESNRLPDIKSLLKHPESQLLVLQQLMMSVQEDDYYAWSETMRELENNIFIPLKQQLKRGVISKLRIMTECGYSFKINKIGKYNFWQKPWPLSSYLK